MKMRQNFLIFYILLITICNNAHSEKCNYCNCTTTRILFNCECTNTYDNICFQKTNNILLLATEKILISSEVYLKSIEELYVHDVCIQKLYFPQKLDKLTKLTLNFCKTTAIDEQSFSNVTNLEELTLENNNIITFNEYAFQYVENLYYLNIKNNSIHYFSETLLKNLSNLMYLNLAMNKIEVLDSDAFSSNNQLEGIFLYKNNIEKLPNKLFDGLINIIEIDLADNKIQELPPGLFSNLNNLKTINLQNNKISSVELDVFKDSPQIEKIYLEGNDIQQIDSTILNLPQLKYINMPAINCDCKMSQFFSIYKEKKLSGNIQCSQPNNNKLLSNLTIEDFACAPKILNCFEEKEENLTKIACLVYGDPLPQVTWIENNFKISDNELYSININTVNNNILWSNLTILNVSTNINELYKIEAYNNGGKSYIEYRLATKSLEKIVIQTESIDITFIPVIIAKCLAVILFVLILFFVFKHFKNYRNKKNMKLRQSAETTDDDNYSENNSAEFKDVVIRSRPRIRIHSTNTAESIETELNIENINSTNNRRINCISIDQLISFNSDLNLAEDYEPTNTNTETNRIVRLQINEETEYDTEYYRRQPEHDPLMGRSRESSEEMLYLPEPNG